MAGDWQDIYLRDEGGGTDVMFDGGVPGWPVHVTDNAPARPAARHCVAASAGSSPG